MMLCRGKNTVEPIQDLAMSWRTGFEYGRAFVRKACCFLLVLLVLAGFAGVTGFAESDSGDEDEPKSFSKICIEFDDNNNASSTRPTQGRFIVKNGEGISIGKDVVITSSDGWKKNVGPYTGYTVEADPKNRTDSSNSYGGSNYQNWLNYSGYTSEVTEDGEYIIRYSLYPEINELSFKLVWADGGNKTGKRPDPSEFVPSIYLSNNTNSRGSRKIASETPIITDNGDNTWTLTFPGVSIQPTRTNRYVWLNWTGTNEANYYTDVTNNGFGSMNFDILNNKQANWQVRQECRNRELPITLKWSDFNNAYNSRPSVEDFTPHLYYGTDTQALREFDFTRDEDYSIVDNGNGTWTITYKSVPTSYFDTSKNPAQIVSNGMFYWLTWDGSSEYLNEALNKDTAGAMKFDRTTKKPTVTTILKDKPLTIKLTWADSGNADGKRPSPADVTPKLWYGTGDSYANGQLNLPDDAWTIKDNGNNTWSLTLKRVPTHADTPSGKNQEIKYYWLTMDGADDYIADLTTSYGVWGAMRFGTEQNPAVTIYPKERTRKIRLQWQDNSNATGERPNQEEVLSSLQFYAGNSYRTTTALPMDGITAKVVAEGENYWDIDISGLPNSYENDSGNNTTFDYYWMTWGNGNEPYINQVTGYNQGKNWDVHDRGPMVFTRDSSSRETVECYLKERPYTVYLNWSDDNDAAGKRPKTEELIPQLWAATESSVIKELEIDPDTYTVEQDPRYPNRYIITYESVPRYYTDDNGNQMGFPYYGFTWKTADYEQSPDYYNQIKGSGLARQSATSNSLSCTCYLKEKQASRYVSVYLHWNNDSSHPNTRPSLDEFKPILGYGGYSKATGTFDETDYKLKKSVYNSNTWLLEFTEIPNYAPDGSNWSYTWISWEPVENYSRNNLAEAPYYSRKQYSYYSWESQHKQDAYIYYQDEQSKRNLTLTLNWSDRSNADKKRPTKEGFIPHLWVGNNSVTDDEELKFDSYEINTNAGTNQWTIKFKGIEVGPANSSRYFWLTWEGNNADAYYSDVRTSNPYRMNFQDSTTSPSVTCYEKQTTRVFDLRWYDNQNAEGIRPSTDEVRRSLKIYYGTQDGVIGALDVPVTDIKITAPNAQMYRVSVDHLPRNYTDDNGKETPIQYYWLTFDSDDYISDLTKDGYGALSFSTSTTEKTVYLKEKRPMNIRLTWRDGGNVMGMRPTPAEFTPHLSYGNGSGILGSLGDDLSYTITDNGDNTWTIHYDAVPLNYTDENGEQKRISTYYLTYNTSNGADPFYTNDIENPHLFGAMTWSGNDMWGNPYVTTYGQFYQLDLKVNWKNPQLKNVTSQDLQHRDVSYDIIDTVTGEVIDTWEPDSNSYLSTSYSHTFYLPGLDEDGNKVDKSRYVVRQNGVPDPGVFETSVMERPKTGTIDGKDVTIDNEAVPVIYRINFTFKDKSNEIGLRPTRINYEVVEQNGNTLYSTNRYLPEGYNQSLQSSESYFTSGLLNLLGRDFWTGEDLVYDVNLLNVPQYYDVELKRVVDNDGVVNLNYTFTLKKNKVVVTKQWAGEDEQARQQRPYNTQIQLLANGQRLRPAQSPAPGTTLTDETVVKLSKADADPQNPDIWYTVLDLPMVDADGNEIIWSGKEGVDSSLQNYHVDEYSEPIEGGGRSINVINTYESAWNYKIDLSWKNVPEANRYDRYETALDDARRTYACQVAVHVNNAKYNKGDLEIRLPYYLEAVGPNGQKKYVGIATPSQDIGVPKAPAHTDDTSKPFNWYLDTHGTKDVGDDELVLVNWTEIDSSPNGVIDVIYRLYPDEHLDTHIYEIQATGHGHAIGQQEGFVEVQKSPTITFGMDTGIDITSFSKNQSSLLYYYNTNLINTSDLSRDAFDPDTYRYVAYSISWNATMNQYARFTLNEVPGQKGEIVSVKTSGSSAVSSYTVSGDKRTWTVTADPQRYSSHYTSASGSATVVVAYPRENNPEAIVKLADGRVVERYSNAANIDGVAAHKQNPDNNPIPPQDLNDEDHMWDAVVTDWGDYRWKPAGKIFAYDKSGSREFPAGGLTALEYGHDISCGFAVSFFAEGETLELDGEHEFYRFNITDNEFYLQGFVNGTWTTYEKLEPGDYEITGVSVRATSQETDKKTGEVLPHVPKGSYLIQGQVGEGGDWETVKTYTWPSNSTATSVSFSSPSLSGRGYTGFRVLTPDRVNRRAGFENITFTVKLKADSEKVQRLVAKGMTQLGLLNIAAYPMELEEPDGSYTLYTEIPKPKQDPAMGTPTHVDSPAFHVGLYNTDEDRKDYIPEEALESRALIYDHYRYEAGPVTSSVGSRKVFSEPIGDSATEIAKSTFRLTGYQVLNSAELPAAINEEIAVDEGYFYDLLPAGWHFDTEAPIIARGFVGNDINEESITAYGKPATFVGEPKVIPDYNGSGRELVIFHVKALGDLRQNYSVYYDDQDRKNKVGSGFSVNFGGFISYDDVFTNYTYEVTQEGDKRIVVAKDNYNLMEFQGVELDEDGNPRTDGNGHYKAQEWELMHQGTTSKYYDDGYYDAAIWNVRGSDGHYALRDVNGDGVTNKNDTLFASAYGNPNFATQAFTGVNKEVRAVSGKWQKHDVTDVGDTYEYRLSFSTGGRGKAYNVVIYDVLEEAANTDDQAQEGYKGTPGYPNEHSWQGTFDSVDISELTEKGIDAKVYYTTEPKDALNYNINPMVDSSSTMDVDKRSDIWTPTPPADPATVTGIAVDMRYLKEKDPETGEPLPAVFEEDRMREAAFIIRMKAPDQLPEDKDAILAYNRPAYISTLEENAAPKTSFNINDRVSVEIMDLQDVVFEKTTQTDDDPNETMKLGGVYFYLYKAKCGLVDGQQGEDGNVHKHVNPPTTRTTTGTSSNACWERIGVVQTTAEGIAKFEKLEDGVYAVREFNPFYSQRLQSSGGSTATAYRISPDDRWKNMWWQFEVSSRKGTVSSPEYKGSEDYAIDRDVQVATGDDQLNPDGFENLFILDNERRRVELNIEKLWQDKGVEDTDRPDEIQVNILRDGEVMDQDTLKALHPENPVNPITVRKADDWKAGPIRNLPMTDPYGQHVYTYTIEEVSIPDGYERVYDTNSDPYQVTGESLEYNRVMYYNRSLTNTKVDQLLIGKTVKEGGDRERLYHFRLTLTRKDSAGKVIPISGETFSYTVYSHYGEENQTEVRKGTFRTDATGGVGTLAIRHGEHMIVHDVPVKATATVVETDAQGYTATYEPASVTIVDSSTGYTEDGHKILDDTKNRMEITNAYASSAEDQFVLYKTINGKRPVYFKVNKFKFTVNEYKPDDLVTTGTSFPITVQNDATGLVSIPKVQWSTKTANYEDDLWYTLQENELTGQNAQGFVLDRSLFVVRVHLRDNGKGLLIPTKTMYRVTDVPEEISVESLKEAVSGLTPIQMNRNEAVARNRYEAKGILSYSLKKTINKDSVPGGRPDAKPYHLNTFEFTLTEWDSTWRQILGSWTAKNNGEGVARFPDFNYDEESINQPHRYTLTEKVVDDKGYTQDEAAYILTVVISDAGQGKMAAVLDVQTGEVDVEAKKVVPGAVLSHQTLVLPTDKDADDYEKMLNELSSKLVSVLKFNNQYVAECEWKPVVLKRVNGGVMDPEFLKHNTFVITLSDASGEVIQQREINEQGEALFSPLVFEQEDIGQVFTYTLKESGETGGGMHLDEDGITVRLRIDDLGNGKLSPVVLSVAKGEETILTEETTDYRTFTFDNPYEAEGQLVIEAIKTVDGPVLMTGESGKPAIGEASLKEGMFTFRMDGDPALVVSNDADGRILFGPITYERKGTRDDRGTHIYTISETGEGPGNYVFDDAVYTLTVEVTDDHAGSLTCEVTGLERTRNGETAELVPAEDGGDESFAIDFHNPTATTQLQVTKIWEDGRDEPISLVLYANGEKLNPQPKPEREGQKYVYHDLPRYDEQGETIIWSVKEILPEGYMVIYDNQEPYADRTKAAYDSCTIRNRPMTDFVFYKQWEGKKVEPGTPIVIQLFRNGKPYGAYREVVPDETGMVVIRNLPADGEYTAVEENLPAGCSPVYVNRGDDSSDAALVHHMGTIINRYLPETGDNSKAEVWFALTALSFTTLLILMLMRKRKER